MHHALRQKHFVNAGNVYLKCDKKLIRSKTMLTKGINLRLLGSQMQDTKNLFINDKKSDSFANHFAALVPENTPKKEVKNFVKVKVKILWKGDPLSCVKTFGTRACKLCNKERMEILKITRLNPSKAINKNTEVHGACRHKPRFHRFTYCQNATSTDESDMDERVTTVPNSGPPESSSSTSTTFSFADNRLSELLSVDINRGLGFETNRLEGLRARQLIGLERAENQSDVDLLESTPQEELDRGECLCADE